MNMKNKEIPILFSTEMVKAILEGRKTQTRRIIKHKNIIEDIYPVMRCDQNENDWEKYILVDEFGEDFLIKPKYKKGDILWVRETFQIWKLGYVYKASYGEFTDKSLKWKPSIFMPKEACRIWLKITNVDVERVQDIDESDSLDEGINSFTKDNIGFKFGLNEWHWSYQTGFPFMCSSAKLAYSNLWEKINGKESWNNNPWVWKIEFEIYDKK